MNQESSDGNISRNLWRNLKNVRLLPQLSDLKSRGPLWLLVGTLVVSLVLICRQPKGPAEVTVETIVREVIVEKTKVLTVTATKYRNRTIVETRPDGTVIKTEERAGSSTVAVDQSLEQVSKKESTQIKKTVEARKQHAYMLDTAVTFPLDSPSDRRYLIGIGARVGNTPLFVTSSVTFNPSNLGSIPMVGVGFRLEL